MRWVIGLILGGSFLLGGCGGTASDANPSAGGAGAGARSDPGAGGRIGTATPNDPGASGSGASGGGRFISDLPRDKTLGSLSDAESQDLCAQTKAFYTALGVSLQADTCRALGLNAAISAAQAGTANGDAALQATCQAADDKCLAEPPGESTVTCDDRPSATCLATVLDYSVCLNDSTFALASQLARVPACSTITSATLPTPFAPGDSSPPASCTAAAQKCPELQQ